MKIAVIGGNGTVGRAARLGLERDHEVITLSRSTTPAVDLTQPQTITAALEEIGPVDALVSTAGVTPGGAVQDLTEDLLLAGFRGKALSQLSVLTQGLNYVNDGGSVTLTSGIIGKERIAKGAPAAMANGALDAFVYAAAPEMPRGIRLNIVSPNVLESATSYHPKFPGFTPVPDEQVGNAYVRAVQGLDTGRIFEV